MEALGDRRHANPGARERALLDESGEAQLLEALRDPPPSWVGGEMWSGPKVARWIEKRNGLEKVHVQRGFEYLRKLSTAHKFQDPRTLPPMPPSGRLSKKPPRTGKEHQEGPSWGRGRALGRGRGAAGSQAGDA